MNKLLLSTALVCATTVGAHAQTQTNQNNTANVTDCDRLIVAINASKVPSSDVTIQQARVFKRDAREATCRRFLADNNVQSDDADAQGAQASQVMVHQQAANIQVQQPTANVRVQQAQPEVTVSQGQPEITVRQPAPTVRIDIPQPIVTVRMPRPDVNVAQAKPQVQVSQAQPKVSIVQPQDSDGNVSVTGTQQQADINYEQTGGQPTVRFERERANIVVNQDQGQPQVRVVRQNDTGDNADTSSRSASSSTSNRSASMNANGDDARTGTSRNSNAGDRTASLSAAQQADQSQMSVSQLTSMQLYNANGNALGDIEMVVRGNDGRTSIVLGRGGFLGLGERMVAVPLDKTMYNGNRLVTHQLTDNQIKAMPTWTRNAGTELSRDQRVNVPNNNS